MKARLVKAVKHDLSSCSSVFTPVSPISKTEIQVLSGKYPVRFYRILPDSRILPDNGIWILYIPNGELHCKPAKAGTFQCEIKEIPNDFLFLGTLIQTHGMLQDFNLCCD